MIFIYCKSAWVQAKDLVAQLLVVNPAQRLSAAQALAHPWIVVSLSISRELHLFGLSSGVRTIQYLQSINQRHVQPSPARAMSPHTTSGVSFPAVT